MTPQQTARLTARTAAFVDDADQDVLMAGVAEHADGTGWSLLFQGGSPDPDVPTEDEEYCLVTETAACVYGKVEAVVLDGGQLRLALERDAAADLGLPRHIEVTLDTDADAITALRDGLARIFAATSLDCRPRELILPGARPPVEARPPQHRRAPRGTRVEYVVVSARGMLAVVESCTEPPVRTTTPAANLAETLGVEPDSFVGRHYTCLVETDRFGTTYSDFRLEHR